MTVRISVLTRGKSFAAAYNAVRRELKSYGCWTNQVSNLRIYQIPFSLAYGFQKYKQSGDIVIPQVSLARMWDNFCGEDYISIRDIIRHEYAHGIAHCHPKMVDTGVFKQTFGDNHDSNQSSPYDPDVHVSCYATKNPCEDFAEVFMYFFKHNGKIPRAFAGLPAIEKKWMFIANTCGKLRKLKQGN